MEDDLERAVGRALELADQQAMSVLIAGGLFLAIEASELLAGRDHRELRFL